MPDQAFIGGIVAGSQALPEKALDMGDGTFARRFATVPVSASGAVMTDGRKAAAASRPVVLSDEDYARIGQTFRRAAALPTPGDGLWVTGVTTAGPVTVTLVNGGSIVANVPLGSSLLQFSATAVNMGSTGGTVQSIFFT